MKCMKWIHLSLVQQLIHGGILIDAIFTTMMLVPLILFRYWMLAGSLAKILGAILSCTSSLCHLALPIYVALCDSCVEPLLKTASQLVCLSMKATCGGDMFIPYLFEKFVASTLRITPLDLQFL